MFPKLIALKFKKNSNIKVEGMDETFVTFSSELDIAEKEEYISVFMDVLDFNERHR